jgi:RHS repeat-associated protein
VAAQCCSRPARLRQSFGPAGNRTGIGGSFARTGFPNPIASASYSAANQQVSFGSQLLTYDANGNLTSDGVTMYTWNARNQLLAITGPGVTASFSYDAFGRRQSRAVNGASTQFLYDGLTPIQEAGSTGLATLLTGVRIDEYLTRTDAAGVRTLVTDALGSTVALTQYTYTPFGATAVTGPADANPFQYTGRENDGTGLYYYRARYYSPSRQRFVSEDPIEFRGGDVNLYGYVSNSPITHRDSFGLTIESNWNFFWDWVLERGDPSRFYGPGSVEGQEMIASPGAKQMRDAFRGRGCGDIRIGPYGTTRAYFETVWDPTSTAFQVGGFVYSAINIGDGQVRYRIYNTAGINSFFLHALPDKARGGGFSFMGNINQTFEWTETSPCLAGRKK